MPRRARAARLPARPTASSDARTRAAAPSVIPEEFPAWTVPDWASKTGGKRASDSSVVSPRGCSSRAIVTRSFLPATSTGAISASKRPVVDGLLRAALRLDGKRVLLRPQDAELADEVLRGLSHELAAEGTEEAVAVHPVDDLAVPHPLAESGARKEVGRGRHALRAARRGRPRSRRRRSKGPPRVSAFRDEAHALLTVYAGTESGTPARWETWRAVLGPPPACRAWPKIVSSDGRGRDSRAFERRPGRDRRRDPRR